MPKKFYDRLKIASTGTKGSTRSQDETSKTPHGFDRKDIKPFDAANAYRASYNFPLTAEPVKPGIR